MKAPWWGVMSVIVNAVLVLWLVLNHAWAASPFPPAWNEPQVVSLMLAAATVVLTGVGVLAGMLAIWGFATLRDHAANQAKEVAKAVIDNAAEAAAERVIRKWLNLPVDHAADDIAMSYAKE